SRSRKPSLRCSFPAFCHLPPATCHLPPAACSCHLRPAPAACRLRSSASCLLLPLLSLVGSNKLRIALLQVLIVHAPAAHHQLKSEGQRIEMQVAPRVFKPNATLQSRRLILLNNRPPHPFEFVKCRADFPTLIETSLQRDCVFKCQLGA